MAVGGVISSRTFGSLIGGSGKVYEQEQAGVRKGEQGGANVNCARGANFKRAMCTPQWNYSYMSRNSFSPLTHRTFLSSERSMVQKTEWEHPFTNLTRINEKYRSIDLRRRVQGRCECFLSSVTFDSSWIQPAKLNKLGISDAQQIKSRKTTTSRADYKSEPYDITGSNLESTESSDMQNEVVLVEEDAQKISSWHEQFPKRWVIVLLCFAAFLLCNMDRVNMSIAILPMSAEFNWNSTTVGLIQSSFFWGYLLTQIVGGIWADKIGGKLVLGFGVIWWSLATVLTPIAAKAGLPFLLAMRAFMGIGEVGNFNTPLALIVFYTGIMKFLFFIT